MTGYVDHEYLDNVEQLTDDNTIGHVNFVDGDLVDDVCVVDPRRLQELLLVAHDELALDGSAHLSTVDVDAGFDAPAIVIRALEDADRGVMLAGKRRNER